MQPPFSGAFLFPLTCGTYSGCATSASSRSVSAWALHIFSKRSIPRPCPQGAGPRRNGYRSFPPGRFRAGTGAGPTSASRRPSLPARASTTAASTSPWTTTIRSNFPPRTDNRPRLRGGSRSLKHAPMECGAGSSGRRRAGRTSPPANTATFPRSTTMTSRAASSSPSSPWP